MQKNSKDTSWERSADWYDEYLSGKDTYQEKVILPNLLRMLGPKKGENILDLACGQGYFSKHLTDAGAKVVGVDASGSLIEKARKAVSGAVFHVSDAAALPKDLGNFDKAICILALQNMESLLPVFKEVKRALKPGGTFVLVINHPAFRIPKRTSWEWDEEKKMQYRRVEKYLSPEKIKIDMHPGKNDSYTWSFHRSLQDFSKALHTAGFAISKMEEWISHRESQKGPRQEAEDKARSEFPLFLAIEAVS